MHLLHTSNVGSHHLVLIWLHHTCTCYIHPMLAATILCLSGCIILALVTYIQCWQPPSCAYLVASYLHLLHTSNVGSHHLVLIWLHHTCTCYIHPMLAATILCLSGCIILALVTYIQCWQPPSCPYLVASYLHLLHTFNVGRHHLVLIWLHHTCTCYIHPMLTATILSLSGCIILALVTCIQCWQPPSCAYLVASYLHLLHTSNVDSHHLVPYLVASYLHLLHASNVGSHHLVLIWLHHTCTCYMHPMLAATILCLSGCIILALVTYIQCWQPPSCTAYLVASYLHLLHTSNVGSHHHVLIWLHHTCTCYIHPMLAATILCCLSGCIILALVTYIQCWQPPSCAAYLVASYCTCYIHPMLTATILCLSGCIILALVTYIQCWQPPSCAAYLVASYLHLLHTSNVDSHHLVLIWLHHTCTCYIHPMLAATILCLSGCIILPLLTYIQCWQPPSCAYLVASYLHLLHTSNVGSHHHVLIWLHHTCTCYIHPMLTATILCLSGCIILPLLTYIQCWQPPSCAYLVASYLHLLHTSNVGSHHHVLIWCTEC